MTNASFDFPHKSKDPSWLKGVLNSIVQSKFQWRSDFGGSTAAYVNLGCGSLARARSAFHDLDRKGNINEVQVRLRP